MLLEDKPAVLVTVTKRDFWFWGLIGKVRVGKKLAFRSFETLLIFPRHKDNT